MRKLEQKETPRELTDEETKAVSGGTSPNSQPNPGWSTQGGGGCRQHLARDAGTREVKSKKDPVRKGGVLRSAASRFLNSALGR